ncbi:PilZ domain-containing protein [Pseudomonadota bacterium]
MAFEDRKHQRTQVARECADNSFHIEVYDRRYVLDKIHDVSISGTGIQIPNEIDPGTPVKLVYRTDKYSISVNGTTVWCNSIPLGMEQRRSKHSYRTGIQFDPKDRNCMLFFMALKDTIVSTKSA